MKIYGNDGQKIINKYTTTINLISFKEEPIKDFFEISNLPKEKLYLKYYKYQQVGDTLKVSLLQSGHGESSGTLKYLKNDTLELNP